MTQRQETRTFQREWSVMRSATERPSKFRTEKYAFNTLIWKLLLKVREVVTCLQWDKERVRGEEIETANVDNC